jgi:hypothetical protein
MSKIVYALIISTLFGLVYGEATAIRSPAAATLVLVLTVALWLVSYLLPPLLFRYHNDQQAPVVLSRLMSRAGIAVACVVVASVFALAATGLWLDLPYIEELFAFTLIGIVLFHGFGGPFAQHVVYLQQTGQYDSDQLAAALIGFTLMLFVLALFFLNLDFGIARDAHVQRRDLLLLTTSLIGYGRTIYLVAHH